MATALLTSSLACKRGSGEGEATNASDKRLLITGSSTVAPLALEIAKRFEQRNPGVRVDVQAGGSSRGVSDVRQGLASIGMISRTLQPSEADVRAYTAAFDGVTMIVNKANPIASLDEQQIVAIYTGVVKSWKAVGGPERDVVVVSKAEGRSTLEVFLQHFKLKSPDVRARIVIGDNEHGIKTIAGNADAIGYVSIGTALQAEARGAAIKLLPMAGVAPTLANVRSREFPLSRPLNFVVAQAPVGLIKTFLEYATSAEVADLVTAQHFVPASDALAQR